MSDDEEDTRETIRTQLQYPYSVTSLDIVKYKKKTLASEVSEQFFKSDFPKWLPNPIYFTFEDPEVRKKLMRLINTDVVKIMDKDFMNNLQARLHDSYWEAFESRLAERRNWEANRRKSLALEGIQPLDDNSLENHPIIQVKKEVEKAFEIIRTRKPYQKRKRMALEYNQFKIDSDVETLSSEGSTQKKPPVNISELDHKKKQFRIKEPSLSAIMSEQYYKKIKYEPPLVKQLRNAHSVNDLYDIAEKILEYKSPYTPLTEAMIKTGLKVD